MRFAVMRRLTLFAVVLVSGYFVASAAMASGGLPRLLANFYCSGNSCTGVYKLRPRNVQALNDPQGGTLTKLDWSSWTATAANATGEAVVSNMGTTNITPIKVSASRPRNGLFTRMTITFSAPNEPTEVERLKLATGNPPAWLTLPASPADAPRSA